MIKIWWFLKCIFRFGSVYDGSICWFSDEFWDVHDYPKDKGGDGVPDHFKAYWCKHCNKKFFI